ncbi:MAG: hypothetical protein HQL70_09610 [Magnetococcales bacterium]|nr:hypothetical protein [Magnetococcales bacterium]
MSVADLRITDTTITGSALITEIEAIFDALAEVNRGATEPAYKAEGVLWWDSSAEVEVLKRYTVTAGWVSMLTINRTTGAIVFSAAGVAAAGAVMDSDFSSNGRMVRTASGAYTTILDKLDATTAPTTGDDTGSGYAPGSQWVDVTNDKSYICVDASTAAAVWLEVGGGGGGGGAWSLVGSATASSSATLSVTGLTGAPVMIVGVNLQPVNNDRFGQLRLGDSGGVDSGATDYAFYSSGHMTNASGTQVPVGFKDQQHDAITIGGATTPQLGSIGSGTGRFLGFTAFMENGVGGYPVLHGSAAGVNIAEYVSVIDFGGMRNSIITTDRVEFSFDLGDISSGSIYVYELATS